MKVPWDVIGMAKGFAHLTAPWVNGDLNSRQHLNSRFDGGSVCVVPLHMTAARPHVTDEPDRMCVQYKASKGTRVWDTYGMTARE